MCEEQTFEPERAGAAAGRRVETASDECCSCRSLLLLLSTTETMRKKTTMAADRFEKKVPGCYQSYAVLTVVADYFAVAVVAKFDAAEAFVSVARSIWAKGS